MMNACRSVWGVTVLAISALARDRESPVPALQAQLLDVGAGGL
jgi:hypothetical protein